MTDSSVTYDKSGHAVSFNGPDAVALYAAASLTMHLKLYLKTGIIPTRGITLKRMNAMAGYRTGKVYKGRKGAEQAVIDLAEWVQAMKLALPEERQS